MSCPASCGARCRGRCVRVTCGCRCGRDHTAALSPACREPRAAPCCCSSSYWPTVCGTALWWTRDTGIGISIFPCLIVFVFTLTLPVLQFNLVLNFTKEQYLSITLLESFLFMPLYFLFPYIYRTGSVTGYFKNEDLYTQNMRRVKKKM